MIPIRWVILLLGICVQQSASQMSQCFSKVSLTTGQCSDLLGEVPMTDCCMNPNYGFVEADGVCKSCRTAAWTQWSPWSKCSVTCTEGVRQRKRMCLGIGACSDPQELGTIQTEPCTEKNCCPVQGGWSEWGQWRSCSVTCETGITKRQRSCSNPPPSCNGLCEGQDEETDVCNTEIVCPTHGGWSDWGSWGSCEGICANEGRDPPQKFRTRTCTNPRPSTVPRGRDCEGSDTESQFCAGLPFCPVHGNWGPWSDTTSCSVTCGVGRNVQTRTCDHPKPKYGGNDCQGDVRKISVCSIPTHCPVHGVWTEWGPWGPCKPPSKRTIKCRNRDGTRRRERDCVDRNYDGNFCDGEILQHGSCFDIDGCDMKAVLSEWSDWSYCKPNCGPQSSQTRERVCIADISQYSVQDISLFSGKPHINCQNLENTTETRECKNVPAC